MKKLLLMIILVFVLFGMFLIIYLIPHNYITEYKINNFYIKESYQKEKNSYYYYIEYKDNIFEYVLKTKYINKRKLISAINLVNLDKGYCFIPESKYIDITPRCYIDDKIIDYHLVPDLESRIDEKYYEKINYMNNIYKGIEIHSLNNRKYLLWNYKSFYYIDEKNSKEINLLDSDSYEIPLATKINDFLFIPNYDEEYKFSDAFIINVNNQKVSKWNLNKDIYFESRVLGIHNKSIYLLDEKNEILYEIVPHKEKLRKVKGQILIDNKLIRKSIEEIIKKNLEFESNSLTDYSIIDNKIYKVYKNTKVLLSNKKVDNIVDVINEDVYYISEDTLYLYNNFKGEVKLLTNFEWSFNKENVIFIY